MPCSFLPRLVVLLLLLSMTCIGACAPRKSTSTPTPAQSHGTEDPQIQALLLDSPLFALEGEATAQTEAKQAGAQRNELGMGSWTALSSLLEQNLAYARRWAPEARAAEHSDRRITWSDVAASLERLRELLPRLDAEPQLLATEFEWLRVTPSVRFTGYFTPIIPASRTRKPGYEYPIYRLPEEIAPHLAACLPTHSCPDEAFTPVLRPEQPFHGRAAIDLDGALRGRGLEMAWLQHPVDTYELMLEGSGVLAFDDGTHRVALFAGLNGNSGRSMAGTLIRAGELPRYRSSMRSIREWWDKNPAKRRWFLNSASGYAFFRFGPDSPQGTDGATLRAWESVAVDPEVIPLAGLTMYALPGRSDVPGGVRHGFAFASDTGGAIKKRRVDMFTGEGERAHREAMSISIQGQIWLLLAKKTR